MSETGWCRRGCAVYLLSCLAACVRRQDATGFEETMTASPARPATWVSLLLLAGLTPFPVAAQLTADERAEFQMELRVGLQDQFLDPLPDGDVATWQARYVESGTLVFSREADEAFETFRISGRHRVTGLMSDAAPVLTDGCGNRWTRKLEDPAHVESESRVSLGVVEGGDRGVMLAIWYRPVSFSLVDPGGPRGKGDCENSAAVDRPQRRTLAFAGDDLMGTMQTEAGPAAMRDDGMVLLGVVSWDDLASGEEIRRSVNYRDSHVRFRARLTLVPVG